MGVVTRPKPGAIRGRPKGPPNPAARRLRLTIRVNAADLELLDRVAGATGATRGEAMRSAIIRRADELDVW